MTSVTSRSPSRERKLCWEKVLGLVPLLHLPISRRCHKQASISFAESDELNLVEPHGVGLEEPK